MVLTGVTVIGLLAFYQGQYREITWKDFVANYLSRGVVSYTVPGEYKKSSPPATFVDISAVSANFCMKF